MLSGVGRGDKNLYPCGVSLQWTMPPHLRGGLLCYVKHSDHVTEACAFEVLLCPGEKQEPHGARPSFVVEIDHQEVNPVRGRCFQELGEHEAGDVTACNSVSLTGSLNSTSWSGSLLAYTRLYATHFWNT